MKQKIFTYIIVTLIVMIPACAQNPAATGIVEEPTLPPTPTEAVTEGKRPELIVDTSGLYGIWQPIPPATVWREYRRDGTFRIAETRENLEKAPLVTGEYWFEGSVLYFKEVSSEPEWACGGGHVGQYKVQVLDSGGIEFVKVEDECNGRAAMLQSDKYKKVEE